MKYISLKRNDTRKGIKATLLNSDGNPTNLSDTVVKFIMADPRGNIKVNKEIEVVDAPNGIVWVVFEPHEVDTAGTFRYEFEVMYSDGRKETYPTSGYLIINIQPDLDKE